MKISFRILSRFKQSDRYKTCTWYDSCAVVTCAKNDSDLMVSSRIAAMRIFTGISSTRKTSLVKKAPALYFLVLSENLRDHSTGYSLRAWCRYDMETLSALLALGGARHLSHMDFPHKWQVMWSFDVFLVVSMNTLLNKQSSGLHDAHVTSLLWIRKTL